MEFRFSPEEEAFRQQVEHFFMREIAYPPDWKPWHGWALERKEEGAFVQGVARKLGQRDWLSLAWPKEYGGKQAPMLDAILAEVSAYYGMMYARDFNGVGLVGPVLIHYGTEVQKHQHLPPIGRGDIVWCLGLSEPEAGSDLAGVRLRADEKDGYFVLNGQKVWISNAHNADWIILLTRSDPQATPRHRGQSMFLVDMKSPGITVRPLLSLAGTRDFNEVFFDNVRVPKENLVGEKNRGFYIAMASAEFDRTAVVTYVANAQRTFDRLLNFVQDKKEMALPSHLRHRLAELAVELEVARWHSYHMVWMFSRNATFTVEPSAAKLFASEMEQKVYEVGMKVLGLYGPLADDSPRAELEGELAYLYQDCLCRTIADGTSEIQRNILATRGLGLPR